MAGLVLWKRAFRRQARAGDQGGRLSGPQMVMQCLDSPRARAGRPIFAATGSIRPSCLTFLEPGAPSGRRLPRKTGP